MIHFLYMTCWCVSCFNFVFSHVYRRLSEVIGRYVTAVSFIHTHTWCRRIRSLISVGLRRPTISSNTAIWLWWSQQGIVGPQPYWFVNKGKQNVTYLSSQDQAGEQRLLMSEALSDITPIIKEHGQWITNVMFSIAFITRGQYWKDCCLWQFCYFPKENIWS